tara:strand:+ start:67 stop:588 length:522 start_codon:yes stop_codon:yes gene_type:complete
MGQEYFINNQTLENKVRTLLPSQGGSGSGFDLSASTQIIPIIDLTESAEGSNIRQDLQTSLSHSSVTAFSVSNTTTTIVNNTGYFRVFGSCALETNATGDIASQFQINDGATTKVILPFISFGGQAMDLIVPYDFNVFLEAGDSLECTTNSAVVLNRGCTRQIADINGTLVNP